MAIPITAIPTPAAWRSHCHLRSEAPRSKFESYADAVQEQSRNDEAGDVVHDRAFQRQLGSVGIAMELGNDRRQYSSTGDRQLSPKCDAMPISNSGRSILLIPKMAPTAMKTTKVAGTSQSARPPMRPAMIPNPIIASA